MDVFNSSVLNMEITITILPEEAKESFSVYFNAVDPDLL